MCTGSYLLLALRAGGIRVAEASHLCATHISEWRGNRADGCGKCFDGVVESIERHIESRFDGVEPQT
jgi:hypothetical protein